MNLNSTMNGILTENKEIYNKSYGGNENMKR